MKRYVFMLLLLILPFMVCANGVSSFDQPGAVASHSDMTPGFDNAIVPDVESSTVSYYAGADDETGATDQPGKVNPHNNSIRYNAFNDALNGPPVAANKQRHPESYISTIPYHFIS